MLDDDGKLKRKYSNKRVNAAHEGIEFKLSFDELCLLMKEADIISSDWGFTGGYYVLARFNDEGPYEYGNCRFITHRENIKEHRTTPTQIESRRNNGKRFISYVLNNPDVLKRREQSLEEYQKRRKKISEERLSKRLETLNPSYKGERNSQYGTMWITDGTVSLKIKKDDLIPEGWRKGRKI